MLSWIHLDLILSIKPLQQKAHPPRMPWPMRAQPEQVAPQRTNNAPCKLVASEHTTSAPSELVTPERTMSAPAGNGATDKVAIEVDGDDSYDVTT
jgi:hypothetical protein